MEGLQSDEDLQTVIDLELRLFQRQVRASAGELEKLLHPDPPRKIHVISYP